MGKSTKCSPPGKSVLPDRRTRDEQALCVCTVNVGRHLFGKKSIYAKRLAYFAKERGRGSGGKIERDSDSVLQDEGHVPHEFLTQEPRSRSRDRFSNICTLT